MKPRQRVIMIFFVIILFLVTLHGMSTPTGNVAIGQPFYEGKGRGVSGEKVYLDIISTKLCARYPIVFQTTHLNGRPFRSVDLFPYFGDQIKPTQSLRGWYQTDAEGYETIVFEYPGLYTIKAWKWGYAASILKLKLIDCTQVPGLPNYPDDGLLFAGMLLFILIGGDIYYLHHKKRKKK